MIICLIAYIIFLQECKRDSEYDVPPGKVLVSESFLDSLNKIPDTITIKQDTVIYITERIHVPGDIPDPQPLPPDRNFYHDSIVTDKVKIWADLTIKGELEDWDWWYQLYLPTIERTVEIPKLYPAPYGVPVFKTGLYGSFEVGGTHTGKFMFGAGLDLVTKKQNIYGLQYIRFGDNDIIGFKIGTRIGRKKR